MAGILHFLLTQVGTHDFGRCRFQVVGADLRQHDDVASAGVSMVRAGGISRLYEALIEESEDGKQFMVRDKNGIVSPFRLFL